MYCHTEKLKIASPDDCKRLLKLGLDPGTASYSYRWTYTREVEGLPVEDWKFEEYKPCDKSPDEQIPCWTEKDLLNLYNGLELWGDETGWTCKVMDYEEGCMYEKYKGRHEVPTLVKGVVWLLKHKVI